MPSCKHPKYSHKLKFVNVKMPDLKVFQPTLLLTVTCQECGDPYTFRAPHGFSTICPTSNKDSTEIRIPVDFPLGEEEEEELQ